MSDKEEFLGRCIKLVAVAGLLGVPVTISEQYPKGLGKTVNPIIQANGEAEVFHKMHFSCFEDKSIFKHIEALNNSGRDQLIIAGIESHVCVLQTCINLISRGYRSYVVTDAIGSRNFKDHKIALKRLESEGAILTTAESTIFEWCKTADRKEFKTISKIIKGG